MKLLKLIAIIAFGLFCGLFCWGFGKRCGVEVQVKDKIPTKIELQQMLVNAGYDIGPKGADGRIGVDTKKAWDLAEVFYGENK